MEVYLFCHISGFPPSDFICSGIKEQIYTIIDIGRKVFGDSFMITDSGRWYRPERINVLKCM